MLIFVWSFFFYFCAGVFVNCRGFRRTPGASLRAVRPCAAHAISASAAEWRLPRRCVGILRGTERCCLPLLPAAAAASCRCRLCQCRCRCRFRHCDSGCLQLSSPLSPCVLRWRSLAPVRRESGRFVRAAAVQCHWILFCSAALCSRRRRALFQPPDPDSDSDSDSDSALGSGYTALTQLSPARLGSAPTPGTVGPGWVKKLKYNYF